MLSLDLQDVRPLSITVAVINIIIFCIFVYFWIFKDQRAEKSGLEYQTWGQQPKWYKHTVRAFLLSIMTFFQSMNAYVFMAFDEGSGGDAALAVFILIFFDIVFTVKMIFVVKREVPKQLNHSVTGSEVKYTKARYQKDLSEIYTPYKFLFKDYRREYSYYKLAIMWLKVGLLYLALICTKYDAPVAILVLLLLNHIACTMLVIKLDPHHQPKENRMLMISFFGNSLITFFILLYALHETTFGIILIMLFYFYLVAQVFIFIFTKGTGGRSVWVRNLLKEVDFTTVAYKGIELDVKMGDKNFIVFNKDAIDLHGEDRLFLVWQRFWDVLFRTKENFKKPKDLLWGF